jgi:hypothetical protein
MRGDLYARITWFHAEKRTQDVDNIVHDVSIREIQVGQEGTFVTGDGLLRIILPAPGNVIGEDSNGSVLRENFPFHFALTLDGSRRIAKANFAIDTSDWED